MKTKVRLGKLLIPNVSMALTSLPMLAQLVKGSTRNSRITCSMGSLSKELMPLKLPT